MYTGVTYVYIITALLKMKTDLTKRKIELNRLIKEQEKSKKR